MLLGNHQQVNDNLFSSEFQASPSAAACFAGFWLLSVIRYLYDCYSLTFHNKFGLFIIITCIWKLPQIGRLFILLGHFLWQPRSMWKAHKIQKLVHLKNGESINYIMAIFMEPKVHMKPQNSKGHASKSYMRISFSGHKGNNGNVSCLWLSANCCFSKQIVGSNFECRQTSRERRNWQIEYKHVSIGYYQRIFTMTIWNCIAMNMILSKCE